MWFPNIHKPLLVNIINLSLFIHTNQHLFLFFCFVYSFVLLMADIVIIKVICESFNRMYE